ncbi:MAG: MATE family efflux transporter [Lentimicrobiaceae bacterium]
MKRGIAITGNTNDLGIEKLGKLLMQYSVPAIIATAAASLYNIIDRIFIGQGVGPLAISGLAITFPLMNITAAFGAMVGVGASTMVSIRLGQQNKESATHILGNAAKLNIILGISIGLISLIFLDPILYALGASMETLPYAKKFMQIILLGNVFTHLYLGLNGVLRSSGYPRKAMTITLITVCINLVLAPIFIFIFKWGIRGAALATVCAQIAGTIATVIHFINKSNYLHFLPGHMKLKLSIIKDIISIGMSNFLMLLTASVVISIMNISLGKYGGDFAIGAYGILYSIAGLVIMIVLGLNQGMQPIVGYNYGAGQLERVIRTYKLTLIAGTCVTSVGFILAELFPRLIASAFTNNGDLIDLTVTGMRLNLMMFPIVGFQIVTSNFFQSIGKAKIAIFLSLTRQLLFLIPALLILPHFWGLNGVWLSTPLADFAASVLTLLVLIWQYKKQKKNNLQALQ